MEKCAGAARKSRKNCQEMDAGEQAGRCGKARHMGERPIKIGCNSTKVDGPHAGIISPSAMSNPSVKHVLSTRLGSIRRPTCMILLGNLPFLLPTVTGIGPTVAGTRPTVACNRLVVACTQPTVACTRPIVT
jgi:hypothetical protein